MRQNFSCLVLSMFVVLPCGALAAGTYYNGNYMSPQQNYANTTYANRPTSASYTRNVMPNANATVGEPYQNYTRVVGGNAQLSQNQPRQQAQKNTQTASKKGFYLGGTLGHEFASWNFDMKEAGSKLHYDNIRWNVLDLNAGYKFGGNFPVQIDAGFRYGFQFGDSTMIDDDITNGGYVVTEWWSDTDNDGTLDYLGAQVGHSLSIGTSNSGNMLGFNFGFGFTDVFKLGGARLTPSVGFRYLKYKLETKEDYGLTVDTGYCTEMAGGEIQCDPVIVLEYPSGTGINQAVLWNPEVDTYGFFTIAPGATGLSTEGTYMFKLPSVSHSYETTWMGPYLAMDLDYEINMYNLFNARFEFGLPMYTSTGDQPYRTDWQHPKSVEDKGGLGDAWHIGLGANYMTALSNSLFLTLGFTFDYYTMSGGDAETYLNSGYYMEIYNYLLNNVYGGDEVYMLANDVTAQSIKQIQSECPGWVCKAENEIESIYKSMGIRIGLQAKF